MNIKVIKITKNQPEQLEIRCHEVTEQVKEIVTFVKSRQGQLTGVVEDKQYEIPVVDVPRRSDNTPVYANSKMEDLLDKAMKQNFVPVLDDANVFIGIVTRKDIMKYFAGDMKKKDTAK